MRPVGPAYQRRAIANKHSSIRVVGRRCCASCVCAPPPSLPPSTTYQQAVSVTAICSVIDGEKIVRLPIPGVKSVSVPNVRQLIGCKQQRQDNQMGGREGPRGEGCLKCLLTMTRSQRPGYKIHSQLCHVTSAPCPAHSLRRCCHCSVIVQPLLFLKRRQVQVPEPQTGSSVEHERERSLTLYMKTDRRS